MAILYLAYRKREFEKELFELSIVASTEKIEKDRNYTSHIILKLETKFKPESAINQIKTSIFGNPEGARGIYHKDKLRIDESGKENELALTTPRDLESIIYSIFLEYVVQQVRDKDYDKLSKR